MGARYPTPPPPRFQLAARHYLEHGELDHLRHELSELETSPRAAVEVQALQDALMGLEPLEAPELRHASNRDRWRRQIHMRSVFELAESYYEHSSVRHICHAAVGRLPCRQREVIEFLFFEGGEPDDLAARRKIATSTVYNHKAQALHHLHGDDIFFSDLCALGRSGAAPAPKRSPNGIAKAVYPKASGSSRSTKPPEHKDASSTAGARASPAPSGSSASRSKLLDEIAGVGFVG